MGAVAAAPMPPRCCPPYRLTTALPLLPQKTNFGTRRQVKAGTLVVLHGANVHLSQQNRSRHSRHAYALHVVEGTPGVAWASDNWLQRPPGLPFEPLFDRTNAGAAP